jgi:hypothetical protein
VRLNIDKGIPGKESYDGVGEGGIRHVYNGVVIHFAFKLSLPPPSSLHSSCNVLSTRVRCPFISQNGPSFLHFCSLQPLVILVL